MVKLIVTDMDNTLLRNDKTLPREIFPLIRRLRKLGICFAVGSARGYGNLSRVFRETVDQMGFLCDNGAYGVWEGTPFLSEPLSREQVQHLLKFCGQISNVSVLLCGKELVYHQTPLPFLARELPPDSTDALFQMVQVADLTQVEDDIFRVGLLDPANPLHHSYPMLVQEFGEQMQIFATDDESVDIMKPGINKGSGLAALQQKLGVTPDETMAFGDYLNDLSMLERASYSYAVENALEEVKSCCRFRAKSNEEGGVIQAIEAFLDTI